MAALAPDPMNNPGIVMRALIWVCGVDGETLRECPAHDRDNVRAMGILMVLVWIYQAALISVVAHRLVAPDGTVHPALLAVSLFIASMLLRLDSYCFVTAGFHADGIRSLARAGLDLGRGWTTKLAAGVFLALRILLSLAFAQLTAIFVGLILYQADIKADLGHQFQHENAAVIAAAQDRFDAETRQVEDRENEAQDRADALQKQITATLRYLRSSAAWRNKERARQAQAALPELERDLRATITELDALRDDLARRISGRDAVIQKEIENSPERVEAETGILAQLKALRRIAADREIAIVILLIDLVSFGLELAAVLAKVTTFIPTTYAALLARNAYMNVVTIADELEAMTSRRERVETGDPASRVGGHANNVTWFPVARGSKEAPAPGKRPRGRPRKDGGLPTAPGEKKQGPENDNERE